MSITDELRKCIDGLVMTSMSRDKMCAIANRIDAEHESKVSYWQGACYKDGYDEGFASADDWLAQHEDAMADHGWVRLPKDEDGEVWHIGDRTESGQTIEAMGLNKHGWHFVGTVNEIDPAIHRHYHAPTVEDVLREFAMAVCKDDALTIRKDVVDEYAAKLMLKEDA